MSRNTLPIVALLALLAAAFFGGRYYGAKDAAALNATIASLEAERDNLTGKLQEDLAVKDAAIAKEVERADKAERQVALATRAYEALKAQKRAIIEETMEPNAIHRAFAKRGLRPILPPQGAYFVAFAQEDAEIIAKGLAVGENCENRVGELENVVEEQKAAIASLRAGLLTCGEKQALWEGYLEDRDALIVKGKEAYEGALAAERRKVFWYKMLAGAAATGLLYQAATN